MTAHSSCWFSILDMQVAKDSSHEQAMLFFVRLPW